jgi:hypothetical protein
MDNKSIEEKEKEYARLMRDIRLEFIHDSEKTDEEVWNKICETPEIIKLRDRSCGANLFIAAVCWNRMELAKKLPENGADIFFETNMDLVQGNALNGAETPEMAEWLFSLGLKPEKNYVRLQSERTTTYDNPLLKAVDNSKPVMIRYWLAKEKELYAAEPDYLEELYRKMVQWAAIFNNSDVWSMFLSDDEVFPIVKNVFSTEQDPEEIKGYRRVLKKVESEDLQERKAELTKALSRTKKKEVPVDKIKLVKQICNGLKSALKVLQENLDDEEVYILSIAVDQWRKSFFVFFNTEDHHAENLEHACDDPWYYRFSENEFYVLKGSPGFFSTATKYLKDLDDQIGITEIYECVVTALDQLRNNGFISKAFGHPVFLTVNAYDVFDKEGLIEIAKKLNGEENCKDYIENIDAFY